jgi:hypothetical protein
MFWIKILSSSSGLNTIVQSLPLSITGNYVQKSPGFDVKLMKRAAKFRRFFPIYRKSNCPRVLLTFITIYGDSDDPHLK